MSNKSIKEKVKDKAKATKEKVKAKAKGAKRCAVLVLMCGLCVALTGCMDTNPASRATSNAIGDVEPAVKVVVENASSNTISVVVKTTFGDGAIASADSSGSTETQTATPSMSIPVKIDARYNDAMAAASTTSKSVLDTLTDWGKEAVLGMMASKATGKVEVEKKDGTKATVECKDGQCSLAAGGCASCKE
ncbi:MAG: hypothetical protein IJG13_06025 [Kiritimatiellae bacterium]|nr:hypothetical protein [Kiritimatiellia bacterium]MBQ3340962.1 hypothetical protein [Kiritimatiellia bacterium]MBQ6330148.1 hypothetical protein [Kiritimatiellia bacterium]